ncbi:MAG TPA: hypothetical protein VNH82_05030 [Candidatus Dormibacteraeota bacterium]|nr:hypothetical protein [Candidatus Dormibacteraeota bacterium]
MAASDTAPGSVGSLSGLRALGMGMVGLCLLQYVVGMVLNLFVSIPRHHPGTSGPNYFGRALQSDLWGLSQGGLLAIHVAVGVLLLVGSWRLAVAAFQAPRSGLRAVSILALLAVVAAGFNGASFLSYGQNLSSMIMAASFAIAMFCFSWVIFRAAGTYGPDPVSAAL